MDDFVVNVRQLAQYPVKTTVASTDVLLLQEGLGGDYMTIAPSDLVGQALSAGGTLQLSTTGVIAIDGQTLTLAGNAFAFSAPLTVPSLTSSGAINATDVLVNGASAATQDFVNNLFSGVVTTVNGRTGDVQLQTSDILQAGGAPIWDPHFGGVVTAPTVWDFRQNDDTVATTAFVQLTLQQLVCGGSFVTSFNGRGGAVTLNVDDVNAAYAAATSPDWPTAPNPALGDASNRIATTLFVDESLQDLSGQIPGDIQDALQTSGFAPINSPNFSGIPTAPTPGVGTATGQLATTAFVQSAIVASTTGVSSFNTRTGAVVLTTSDVTNAGGAPLVSPVFTGTPQAPTPTTGDTSTKVATTAFVMAEIGTIPPSPVTSFNTRTGAIVLQTSDVTGAGGAPLTSPALTGTPTAPTATAGTNTTQLATTAFVEAAITALGTTVQSFNGRTGAVSLLANDVSAVGGALLASPAFSGSPTAPTPSNGTNNTQLATTAFVQAAVSSSGGVVSFNTRTGAVVLGAADVTGVGGALLASPAFSGVPSAPTPAQTSNDTTLATTSFVKAAIAAAPTGVTSFNSRTGPVTFQANDVSAVGGALLAGPTFTGTPSAPTASPGNNTAQLATTAFVSAAIAALPTGANSVRYDISQSLTATQQAQARANTGTLKKNYIVNGAMMVTQENGTAAITSTSGYVADQWLSQYSSGTVTAQNTGVVTPAGSPNRLRVVVNTAVTSPVAADYALIVQRIEGGRMADLAFGTAQAKTVTVQFGCNGPAGTYSLSLRNGALNRSYVDTFTIAAGEANTDVIKSVTFPGDVTGTWVIDTTLGVTVCWSLMVGSNLTTSTTKTWITTGAIAASGQSNWQATVGNRFDLFDVGLYEGSAAPAFQVPDPATEFVACMRYFQTVRGYNLAGTGGAGGGEIATVTLPVVMRATPSSITHVGTPTLANCTEGSANGLPIGGSSFTLHCVPVAAGGFQMSAASGSGFNYNARL